MVSVLLVEITGEVRGGYGGGCELKFSEKK